MYLKIFIQKIHFASKIYRAQTMQCDEGADTFYRMQIQNCKIFAIVKFYKT